MQWHPESCTTHFLKCYYHLRYHNDAIKSWHQHVVIKTKHDIFCESLVLCPSGGVALSDWFCCSSGVFVFHFLYVYICVFNVFWQSQTSEKVRATTTIQGPSSELASIISSHFDFLKWKQTQIKAGRQERWLLGQF